MCCKQPRGQLGTEVKMEACNLRPHSLARPSSAGCLSGTTLDHCVVTGCLRGADEGRARVYFSGSGFFIKGKLLPATQCVLLWGHFVCL